MSGCGKEVAQQLRRSGADATMGSATPSAVLLRNSPAWSPAVTRDLVLLPPPQPRTHQDRNEKSSRRRRKGDASEYVEPNLQEHLQAGASPRASPSRPAIAGRSPPPSRHPDSCPDGAEGLAAGTRTKPPAPQERDSGLHQSRSDLFLMAFRGRQQLRMLLLLRMSRRSPAFYHFARCRQRPRRGARRPAMQVTPS